MCFYSVTIKGTDNDSRIQMELDELKLVLALCGRDESYIPHAGSMTVFNHGEGQVIIKRKG